MKFSFYMFKKICKPFSALFSFFFCMDEKNIFLYMFFFLLSIKKLNFPKKKERVECQLIWFQIFQIEIFYKYMCFWFTHILTYMCILPACVCSLSNKMNLFMYNWSVENYISFVCISYIKIICVLSPFMCDWVEFDVSI